MAASLILQDFLDARGAGTGRAASSDEAADVDVQGDEQQA
jgi:hypothetical protein